MSKDPKRPKAPPVTKSNMWCCLVVSVEKMISKRNAPYIIRRMSMRSVWIIHCRPAAHMMTQWDTCSDGQDDIGWSTLYLVSITDAVSESVWTNDAIIWSLRSTSAGAMKKIRILIISTKNKVWSVVMSDFTPAWVLGTRRSKTGYANQNKPSPNNTGATKYSTLSRLKFDF